MNTKTTSSLLIVSIITTLIFAATGYFLFQDFRKTTAEAVAVGNDLEALAAQKETMTQLQGDAKSTEDARGSLDSLFVKKDQVADFIKTLESVATRAGVTHTLSVTSQPDDSLEAAHKEFLIFQLNISGKWSNVVYFLSLMENLPYKISERTMNLSVDTSNPKESIWSGALTITVVKDK